MIVRDGYVAMQHYTSNPYTVKVGDAVYNWTPKNNVSLGWVKEEDLPRILTIDTKACCGKRKKRFFLASQINVNLHETGSM